MIKSFHGYTGDNKFWNTVYLEKGERDRLERAKIAGTQAADQGVWYYVLHYLIRWQMPGGHKTGAWDRSENQYVGEIICG